MKKSILALVLASLALPTMAINLTDAQQVKLDNAWSVLTANGVDPTVMKNNLNIAFVKSDPAGNITKFNNTFVSNFAREGKDASLLSIVNGKIVSASGNWIKTDKYNGQYRFNRGGNTASYATQGYWVESTWNSQTNLQYDLLTQNGYGYHGDEAGINRLDTKIIDADISGDVGSAIQGKVHGLKSTIKNIGRLEAAAELAKSIESTCIDDKSTNACTGLGVKFSEIGRSIERLDSPAHYTYQGDIWLASPTAYGYWVNQTTEESEHYSYLNSWAGSVYHTEVAALDAYESSLTDISDIAGAFIEINNSNALFSDLTDL